MPNNKNEEDIYKNPYINPGTLGFIGIFGLPIFGEITGIYPPFFDTIWIASWGFLLGSAWSEIYHEKQHSISEKLSASVWNMQKEEEISLAVENALANAQHGNSVIKN